MNNITESTARFNGPDYNAEIDNPRLVKQLKRIYDVMKDGQWRTLHEIHSLTLDPEASISAQLRHLRKERFGAYIINRRRKSDSIGLYEYQLIV
jgi:hypothetical protein